jgi:hypothetical protein
MMDERAYERGHHPSRTIFRVARGERFRGQNVLGGRYGHALPACCGRRTGAAAAQTVHAVCGLIH